jgi:dihydroorotase
LPIKHLTRRQLPQLGAGAVAGVLEADRGASPRGLKETGVRHRSGRVQYLLCFVLMTVTSVVIRGQNPEFDLLIKNGHVIDPKNGIDAVRDVAVAGGKIAMVAENIGASRAREVADATGFYVTPGLIDMHAHVFWGSETDAAYSSGYSAVQPDDHSFRSGQTTLVDAGGSGWRNFPQFKSQVIDRSKTRILAFLNIVGSGMKGGPVEQNLADMDPKLTAMRIRQYRDFIIGIKVAHYNGPEWDPVIRAVEAGTDVNVPVMVDFGGHTPPLSLEDLLLKYLRPGDILTHAYANVNGRTPIVDENGKLRPYVLEARKRGIIFDAGHGGGSFVFRQAVPATKQDFYPDVISTDLHVGSMNSGMKDILNTMSKFLNLGMPIQDVIKANTSKVAEVIRRPDLGHLSVGAEADIAVLNLRRGKFGFIDVAGAKMPGDQKLECELTVKAGQVMWDLNGISRPLWTDVKEKP